MKTVGQLIEKYQGKGTENTGTVAYSCKITGAARIKIYHLSLHIGQKRTRLAGELLEAAINEAFEQVYEDLEPGQMQAYEEEMANYEEEQSHQ